MKTKAEIIKQLESEIERLNCEIQDSDFIPDMYNRGYLFGYLYALSDSEIISKDEFEHYNNLLIAIVKE